MNSIDHMSIIVNHIIYIVSIYYMYISRTLNDLYDNSI